MKQYYAIAATLLLLCLAWQGKAQTNRLFWYEGKQLKPNVLLTQAGDTVVYTPSKGLLRVCAGTKSSRRKFDDMQLELRKTPQRINEMIQSISTRVPEVALPLLSKHVQRGFAEVNEQFGPLLASGLLLPDEGPAPVTAKTKGPAMNDEEDYFELFRQGTADVLEHCKQRASEDITFVPAPPRKDLSYTAPCNTEKQTQYQREMEVFLKELGGGDTRLAEHVLGISRQANFLLTAKQNDIIQPQLKEALDLLLKVGGKKIRRLLTDYGDDAYRTPAILEVVFALDRQTQLMGGPDLSEYIGPAQQKCYNATVALFRKAMAEKEYSIVLNHPLLFQFNRQCYFLGWPSPQALVAEMLSFDRFKMDVHISAKITGGDGGFQLAELKAENWFFASPFEGCRLQWSLMGPQLNKLQGKLLATDWRGVGGSMTYAGPLTWYGEIPKLRLDFSKVSEEIQDTANIYQFDAEGYDEKWNIPKVGVTKVLAVNNCLMNCFIDVERLKEEANTIRQNPADVEKLKAQMLKQYNQLIKDNKLTNMQHTKDYGLEALQMAGRLQQNSRKISEMIHQTGVGTYALYPVVNNKTAVVVDARLDGKEVFPENAATEYAHFFLKITHDPKGPFGL